MTRQTTSDDAADNVRRGNGHTCVYCEAVLAKYESGLCVADIGRALGLSFYQARSALTRHGIIPEKRPSLAQLRHVCGPRCHAIIDGYQDEGASLETLSIRFKLSRERIRQIVRYHKVPIRQPGCRKVVNVHVCNAICDAILAAPSPISATAIADEHGWPPFAVDYRARVHRVAVRRWAHQCGERCKTMLAYLSEHPEATVYSAASALRIPASWTGNIFRAHHAKDGWRVRPYRVHGGRRVASEAQPSGAGA